MRATLSFFIYALIAGFIIGALFNWVQGKSELLTLDDASKHLALSIILTIFFLRSIKANNQ
jgi:fructose-specific phosphotransferase system IIC component